MKGCHVVDISLFMELAHDSSSDNIKKVYDEATEQIVLADELGYRTVWFTEHHFLPGFSESSAPEVFLGYIAGRTKRIRLGHGVVLLPFNINHPARVAERAATLDLLSGGRVEWGGGRSIAQAELGAFGVDADESRIQWEEALRVIPKMWTRETFEWDSELLKFPSRNVTPKPLQKPHPPMYVAATQPATCEFAGRNGLGALAFGIQPSESGSFVEIYKKAAENPEPIGEFAINRFNAMITTLCLDDDREAFEVQGGNYKRYIEYTKDLYAPWKDKAPPSYEWYVRNFQKVIEHVESVSVEDLVEEGGAAIGNPERVARVLQQLVDGGVDEIMFFMQSFTTPHDKIMRSIELIAKEVVPLLKPRQAAATV
jgi:alkanesulfonate monooxygenase SsuD/methylene tetrahydromethanopterin reductase-like flavin-dependent oxidoreductase (luciferase family)